MTEMDWTRWQEARRAFQMDLGISLGWIRLLSGLGQEALMVWK